MKTKMVIFGIAFILLIAACGSKADNSKDGAELSAGISEISGTVEIKNPNDAEFASANNGSTLQVNGSVRTAENGRAKLALSSGTIVRVAPSSIFTLVSNVKTENGLFTKLKVEAGYLFVILNGGEAQVETPSGLASVRGSYLSIEVDPVTGDVYVTCLEGDCHAQNESGEVNLVAGQKTILYRADPSKGTPFPPTVGEMSQEDFDNWTNNNPEATEVFDDAKATMDANATSTATPSQIPQPTSTPQPSSTPEPSETLKPSRTPVPFTPTDKPTKRKTPTGTPCSESINC